jgi:hypothetical protein
MKRPVMEVSHFDDLVTIAVPPALARDLAAVWSSAHATDPILAETRPDWHHDVIALIANSVRAEQHADAARVDVPLLTIPTTTTGQLRLVEEARS